MSKPYTALGLMSGTSMDGIDVALLETDGETIFRHGNAATIPYDDMQRNLLRQALAEASDLVDRNARPGMLRHIESEITRWHHDAVTSFLQQSRLASERIDVIGFHGQTVIHRPAIGLTVQLGLGQELASSCGIPVVYDLRANDMQHGGQGAPLVPAYHRALAQSIKASPIAIVNIGGVSNVTWIGPDGTLVAFDTGPGNALLDDWMKKHTGYSRDEGGRMGLSGHVDEATVSLFLSDGFFEKSAPKSLDRNSFASYVLDGLNVADGAATLVAITARSIAHSIRLMPEPPTTWIVCGGGRHNKAIMRALENQLKHVQAAEQMTFDGDAIEAEAWAFLAVRSLRGLPLTFPGTTGVRAPVTGGILAKPI